MLSAGMSAGTQCGSGVVDAPERSFTDEERSLTALYQCWKLEEAQPGIIEYILEFGRNNLNDAPCAVLSREAAAKAAEQIVTPRSLSRGAEVSIAVDAGLPSTPETMEEAQCDLERRNAAEKPALDASEPPQFKIPPSVEGSKPVRGIKERLNRKRPLSPSFMENCTQRPAPGSTGEISANQDEQSNRHSSDRSSANGQGWIRLGPKDQSSIGPHRVADQRYTTFQAEHLAVRIPSNGTSPVVEQAILNNTKNGVPPITVEAAYDDFLKMQASRRSARKRPARDDS